MEVGSVLSKLVCTTLEFLAEVDTEVPGLPQLHLMPFLVIAV